MSDQKNINEKVRFETADIDFRVLAYIGAGIIAAAAIFHFGLYFLYRNFAKDLAEKGRLKITQLSERRQMPPEPRLQSAPELDRRRLRQTQIEKLNSYGWTDKANGRVRIPVEEAMKTLAAKGLSQTPHEFFESEEKMMNKGKK